MRILDVVVFFGRLKGMSARRARSEGDSWLERMGLSEWRRSRVETLSKGMQQKVQFIATVIHQPELVFLDEPTAGLDPVNQDVLKDTMRGLRDQGKTVVFSTHNMAEAEQLCDSVCIISRGRKILDGPLDEIRRANRGNRWRIQYDEPPEAARELFGRRDQFADVVSVSRGWEVTLDPNTSVRSLLTALITFEEVPSRVERIHPSLHEIFVQHVGGVAATAARKERADA
jgi:ABC-2 type transport system ATP-binding protein